MISTVDYADRADELGKIRGAIRAIRG